MYNKQPKEIKVTIVQRYANGESVAHISADTKIPRSTLYLWIREARVAPTKKARLENFARLQQMQERLQRVIQILQAAPCMASAPLQERLEAITLMSKDYNVNILCFALKVAKGTYYNHILSNKRGNTVYAQRKAE